MVLIIHHWSEDFRKLKCHCWYGEGYGLVLLQESLQHCRIYFVALWFLCNMTSCVCLFFLFVLTSRKTAGEFLTLFKKNLELARPFWHAYCTWFSFLEITLKLWGKNMALVQSWRWSPRLKVAKVLCLL